MSQATAWGNYTSGPASPNDYAAREKESFDALLSMHSGSSRPSYALVGTQWADTSVSGKIAVKVYDGVGDRLIYTIDTATGLKTFAALDLTADPSTAMQPATKQYADAKNALQSISASVATNALTVGFTPQGPVSFRNPTLANGAPVSATPGSLSLVVPSGATLGTVNGVQSQIALVLLYNGGSPVLGVVNLSGGVSLDETSLLSTTAIDTASDSAGTVYSASAVTSSPFRFLGFVTSTQATAGTWATAPSLVQGAGGNALNGTFAPKPTTIAGVGQFAVPAAGGGVAFVLPAGGTWLYWAYGVDTTNGSLNAYPLSGVAAGGSTTIAGITNRAWVGFCWRIA